jgi:hypothetical protein
MRLTSQPSVFKQAQARRNAEPLAAKTVNDLLNGGMPLYWLVYKAWLRATLQKFADDVREIEARNEAERSRDHHAA